MYGMEQNIVVPHGQPINAHHQNTVHKIVIEQVHVYNEVKKCIQKNSD